MRHSEADPVGQAQKGRAREGAGERAAREAGDSKPLEHAARVGVVAYGVVHLLVAWLALQVAWSHSAGAPSGTGALHELAQKPLGVVLLGVVALGLVALALWQLSEAVWGHRRRSGGRRTWGRLGSAGRAVVYLAIAWSAARTAIGSGGGSSQEESATARLMAAPGGVVAVGVVALVIVSVGVVQIRRAMTAGFTDDLAHEAMTGPAANTLLALGISGYLAKGIAIGAVGALFGWSAVTFDPDKAGGIDDAFRTLLEQPFGPVLVTVLAAGIAAFGVYCLAWARHLRT